MTTVSSRKAAFHETFAMVDRHVDVHRFLSENVGAQRLEKASLES